MRRSQPGQDTQADPGRLNRRQRPAVADRVAQRPERHEFHHDDRPAIIVDYAQAGDYPADEARTVGYAFPYLVDESQDVAKAYRAACTPDFFLFDADRRLVYRGQFDDSRPSNGKPVTGADLKGVTACHVNVAPSHGAGRRP